MDRHEFEIEKQVYRQLSSLKSHGFILKMDYPFSAKRIDIAIILDNRIVANIEIKKQLQLSYKPDEGQFDLISRLHFDDQIDLVVITNGDEYYIHKIGDPFTLSKWSLKDLSDYIISLKYPFERQPSIDAIKDAICTYTGQWKSPKRIDLFLSSLDKHDLEYDETAGTISFPNFKTEDDFFISLLPPLVTNDYCRYSNLQSLFSLLKEKKQNMCNIVCMNDKGEMDYADKYIYGEQTASAMSDQLENDRCFILSLMEKNMEDNLTMWRLYGDDAKGVCYTYRLLNTTLKNSSQWTGFSLAKVSYGIGPDNHPELALIKNLMLNHTLLNGWVFRFNRWYLWKHFFKSHLFADEKEVRLLYLMTSDDLYNNPNVEGRWIINAQNSIVSKMLLFPLGGDKLDYPLQLSQVLIGPKCQEQEVIRKQFAYMADERFGKDVIDVLSSDIDQYR